MALSRVEFYSEALKRVTAFHIYLPNDVQSEFTEGNPHYMRETKTLYLLHGYTGNTSDWIVGSSAMEISRDYNVAIVMPSGENSFYIDRACTGGAYETFTARELPAYIERTYHLSAKPEDVWIGGLSMGGYGALRLGLKYPETYGAAIGLSSALIVKDLFEAVKHEDSVARELGNEAYYRMIFGDLETAAGRDVNPEVLVEQKLARGERFPRLFMACGTEDFLIENNREFRDFLSSRGVACTYHESAGIHNWKFWDAYLEPAVRWALGEEDGPERMA